MDYYFGVDVGGTNIKLGLFCGQGDLMEKWEIPAVVNDQDRLIGDMADQIQRKLRERKIAKEKVLGVGVGMPGPVLEDGYVECCVNLGIRDMNPRVKLSRLLLGIPVRVGNDANAAALGELWKGGGMGYQSLMLVTLGTGVGSGLILDGRIVCGSKGLAGEIGHIPMDMEETESCNCGNKGCLDQIASATGIVKNTRRILKRTKLASSLREKESFTAKDVLDAAKDGDQAALSAVDHSMRYLGQCLAAVTCVVDPQVFVIGGGLSKAGSFLLTFIRKYYDQYAVLKKEKADIVLASLGNDAGIYGAAKMNLV